MVRVTQRALKPATYDRVGAYGRDRIAKVARETNRLLKVRRIPLLDFHTKPDDPRGLPHDPAGASEISKGWVAGVRQTSDGWLEYDLEVTDPKAAEAMQSGSVQFTSPQLSKDFPDGIGGRYEEAVTHVALTPHPRNPEQGRFIFDGSTAQFSLEDLMDDDEDKNPADEGDEAEKESPPAAEANPDIPPPAEGDQKSEAIIAGLALKHIILPAGTTFPADIADVLIAAINSANSAEQASEAAKSADDLPDNEPEESQPVQFSADEIAALPVSMQAKARAANEAAKKAKETAVQFALSEANHKREATVAAIKGNKKLPAGLRNKLIARAETVQFSADGESASLTLAEAATLFAESIPAQFAFEELEEATDPSAVGGPETPESADAAAKQLFARNSRKV